ncbi:MAG: GTP 3',8-cyclase MoaA [Bacteroidia bacterium]|nr:GTP 3',8-cyclase MoaA [Bacteroidia bacterium]
MFKETYVQNEAKSDELIDDQFLFDKFGRKHTYLRISITDKCNLRCTYCMPKNGIELQHHSKYMNRSEILQIAKVFCTNGINKIRITGGEPLVRKDVSEILRDLSQLPVSLGISTNGILVDQFIDLFREIGLRSINISLDSLIEEKQKIITRRNYHNKIIENIHLLIKNDFDVKINTVLLKGKNSNEILDFIELTKDASLDLRFIEFMPFRDNKWDWKNGISQDMVLDKISAQFGIKNVVKLTDPVNSTSNNYKIKGYDGNFGFISTVTKPFCDSCNRLRLTADGKLKNCLFSSGETDLLKALRSGTTISTLIKDNVRSKKRERAGMDSFEKFSDSDLNSENRSMISIGG